MDMHPVRMGADIERTFSPTSGGLSQVVPVKAKVSWRCPAPIRLSRDIVASNRKGYFQVLASDDGSFAALCERNSAHI
jgi:hypothetical protein